ncbi:hypothetical protein QM012_009406 [Aureobasidium pullulans]|uniref:Uncharacterized protein n=1 Tax=Aureobasidium pullulans TaxID=5580 RepID=A0ABR0TI94_AURPU
MAAPKVSNKGSWRTYGSTKVHADKSLGMAKFSKAKVDCLLLRNRLRWGIVSSPHSQDSALLYLKIQFWQPKDCRLQYVEAETEIGSAKTINSIGGPYISITQPGQICGQAWQEHVESSLEVAPHVEVVGNGGKLGGYSRNKTSDNEHRWSFTLQKHPDENGDYTKLAWKWEEQDKGASVPFERPIYVAVVIGHDRSTLDIRTQLKGKLVSSFRRGWKNLMFAPANRFAVPLAPELSDPPEDLTTIVEGLQQTIEDENRSQAPIGMAM